MQPPGGQEPSDPPPILLKEGGGNEYRTLEGRDKYGDKKGLILNTTPPIILLTYEVKRGGAETK